MVTKAWTMAAGGRAGEVVVAAGLTVRAKAVEDGQTEDFVAKAGVRAAVEAVVLVVLDLIRLAAKVGGMILAANLAVGHSGGKAKDLGGREIVPLVLAATGGKVGLVVHGGIIGVLVAMAGVFKKRVSRRRCPNCKSALFQRTRELIPWRGKSSCQGARIRCLTLR